MEKLDNQEFKGTAVHCVADVRTHSHLKAVAEPWYRSRQRLHTRTVVARARLAPVAVVTALLATITTIVVVLLVAIAHVVITIVVVRHLAAMITIPGALGTTLPPLVACGVLLQKSTLHRVALTVMTLTVLRLQDAMEMNHMSTVPTIVHRGLAHLPEATAATMSALPATGRWSFSPFVDSPSSITSTFYNRALLIISDARPSHPNIYMKPVIR